jgi:ketosteroid isomerase-like protein
MSKSNEETARRWLQAVAGEDYETVTGLVSDDVVLVPPGDQAPYEGAESMRRWMQPDAFPAQVITPLEVVAVTETTVLGRQHISARGRASGIELDVTSWSVWTFAPDGRIARIEIYLDHEEDKARTAAGVMRGSA